MKLVFVSSTFKDMQAERDALQNVVAPLLDNQISKYGEGIFFNDLRWGVNTTNMSSDEANKKILDVCLDEIDGCKPYMIVLVGERYGWIPEKTLLDTAARSKGITVDKSISVTELEIEYGALMRPEYKGKVLFYFRELDKTGMSDADKKNYEAESSVHRQKIEELKSKIRRICPGSVKTYKAKWDRNKGTVGDLKDFCNLVYKDLEQLILGEIKQDMSLSWQEKTMKSAGRYYEEHALEYLHVIQQDYASSRGGESYLRIVEGDYGSGKTMELSWQYHALKKEIVKVPFVTGLDQYSSSSINSLAVLLYKMEEELGGKHLNINYENFDVTSVINQIKVLDKKVRKTYFMMVDNADELLLSHLFSLFEDDNVDDVTSMKLESVHHFYIQIAYSSSEKKIVIPAGFNTCFRETLVDINEGEVENYIFSIAKSKRKEVSKEVAESIANKISSYSPLYSKLVFDRISNLDQDDFKAIEKAGGGMMGINKYLTRLVSQIGDFIPDIVKELVKEASQRIDRDFVIHYLGILAYSGTKVSYNDINYVFNKMGQSFSNVNFASVNKYLSTLINRHSALNAYSLINQQVRNAVIEAIEEIDGDTFVDDFTRFILNEDISSIWQKHLLPALSNSHDADLLAKTLYHQYASSLKLPREEHLKMKRQLGDIIFWYIEKFPYEYPALIIRSLLDLEPRIDWSFLFERLPTVYISGNLLDRIKGFLQEIIEDIGPDGLYGSTDGPVLSVYMKAIQKRAELLFLIDKSIVVHSIAESNQYSVYPYSIETRAKLDLITFHGFCLNHIDAEEEDYGRDHFAILYNEREFNNSDQRLYLTTVHKALCMLVAGRFQSVTNCDVNNGMKLLVNGVSNIDNLNLYTPGIKENITSFDIYLIVNSIIYFIDDFKMKPQDLNYFIGVALKVVKFGIEEIDMRLSGLLTEVRFAAVRYQRNNNSTNVYLPLYSYMDQKFMIASSLESKNSIIDALNACGEIAKYHFFDNYQHISDEDDMVPNYAHQFDKLFGSLTEEGWITADNFYHIVYTLFFHLRTLINMEYRGSMSEIINKIFDLELKDEEFPSFTYMCKGLLLISCDLVNQETEEGIVEAYQNMIDDPDYGYVLSEYKDIFNIVKQLYDL